MISKLTQFVQSALKLDSVDNLRGDAEQQHIAKLAALALLIELSRADGSSDSVEEQALVNTATNTLGLSHDDQTQWLEQARQNAEAATSLYEFTDTINNAFSAPEKFELIANMWRIAYADGELDKYEDHLIRKVAELIYVSHSDFIRAKHIAKQELHRE